ncbi:MAG: GntR family transcriptional regulator [Actinomycetota bacterium]|nr:GntR family transcriptional regulator [Actinomycetota bacterium]
MSGPAGGLFGAAPNALTKTDLAYEQIREAILAGRFEPGSVLDQELLAEQLKLSTTPVREALRRLESERLVVRRAHRDTVVAPLAAEVLEESFTIHLALDPVAASLAATNATAEERRVLNQLLDVDEPGGNTAQEVHAHRRLHRAIYGACHNSILVEMLDSLWNIMDRYRYVSARIGTEVPAVHRDHAPLLEAVIAGRPREAARLMRLHTIEGIEAMRGGAD